MALAPRPGVKMTPRCPVPPRAVAALLPYVLIGWCAGGLWAVDLTGRVVNHQGAGVDAATVVLLELDLVESTSADGHFAFADTPPGVYTLRVYAPGYHEWEGSVTVDGTPIVVTVSPEVVEMDVIVVSAKVVAPEEALDNKVSTEDLARLPTRGDPLEAVTQEAGILMDPGSGTQIQGSGTDFPTGQDGPGTVELDIQAGEIGRINPRRSGVSVYGGQSDWNNYYYGYIRIPTNTHAFGFPDPSPIVPVEAVDSIDIYKGVIPVEHGPAIGGLFVMQPDSDAESFEITLTPSIMDISLLTRWPITKDLSVLLSLNQSIVQYTVLPLIGALSQIQSEEEVNEEGDPTSFWYGDAVLRLLYTPPRHSLSIDFLAYYDRWLFDVAFGNFALRSEYGPFYLAGGSRWAFSPTAALSNSVYAYAAYYRDFGDSSFHLPRVLGPGAPETPEALYDIHVDWTTTVPSVQFGDELYWSLNPMFSVLVGVNARLAQLNGQYTESVVLTDSSDVELSNETIELEGVDEIGASTYGYVKVQGELANAKYSGGAGVLWYPGTAALRPSLSAELLLFNERTTLAVGAGWSAGIIDEFTYIDRRLDEQYYDLESVTDLYAPPMAVSAAVQLVTQITQRQSIGLSPYFAWYYDLSGIAVNTSGTDPDGAFISYDPLKGYSAGLDVKWHVGLGERWDMDMSYALSWTRYLTEEWGWTAPNSEVRHALKVGLLYSGEHFRLGQNLLVYSGVPFTPEEVVADDLGNAVIVQGDYNSAMDYVPRFDVRTNLSYTWNLKRSRLSVFLNGSNWLDLANGTLLGIDPDLQQTVGTSSATFSSREYDYSVSWTEVLLTLLLSEIGLSLSF